MLKNITSSPYSFRWDGTGYTLNAGETIDVCPKVTDVRERHQIESKVCTNNSGNLAIAEKEVVEVEKKEVPKVEVKEEVQVKKSRNKVKGK